MNELSNETFLLTALNDHQEWAFTQVYESYNLKLLFMVERMVGQQHIAEDIVAESFIKLLKQKESFSSILGVKYFLVRVARNAAIDWLRAEKRHALAHREVKYLNADNENGAERVILRAELISLLYEEIQKLPPRYAEIITRCYLQGESLTEIAEGMGLAYKTVKNLKAKALQQLKIQLPGDDLLGLLLCICLLK